MIVFLPYLLVTLSWHQFKMPEKGFLGEKFPFIRPCFGGIQLLECWRYIVATLSPMQVNLWLGDGFEWSQQTSKSFPKYESASEEAYKAKLELRRLVNGWEKGSYFLESENGYVVIHHGSIKNATDIQPKDLKKGLFFPSLRNRAIHGPVLRFS